MILRSNQHFSSFLAAQSPWISLVGSSIPKLGLQAAHGLVCRDYLGPCVHGVDGAEAEMRGRCHGKFLGHDWNFLEILDDYVRSVSFPV